MGVQVGPLEILGAVLNGVTPLRAGVELLERQPAMGTSTGSSDGGRNVDT